MAEKDWILQGEEEDFIQWYNPSNRLSTFVYKQDYATGKKSEWFFEVSNSKKTFEQSRPKKTKEIALRLAKTWMRNHK